MKRLSLILAILILCGCGPREPQHVQRPGYDKLSPDAKRALKSVLNAYFGTPTSIRVWEGLPVHHSGAVGTITETVAGAGGKVTAVKVEWQDEAWPIRPGQRIGWLSENLQVGSRSALPTIASYDNTSGLVTFEQPLDEAPEAGTRLAANPGELLHQGRLLYAEHCLHCHGVSGDGNGPTARYLNPRPRDYRDGTFKFSSTPFTHPPSRSDLAMIIEDGIPGTYMPSFKLLTPEESSSLVEYVRFLAMRGQAEKLLLQELAGKSQLTDEDLTQLGAFLAEEAETVVTRYWVEADQPEFHILPETPRPEATPDSIAKGRELFLSAKAKCSDCHGVSGRGNGFQTYQVEEAKGFTQPGLHDDWGQIVQPRDLRSGIYRGGRRPLDIYRRVATGIKGTPMNGFKTNLYDSERKDEDVWHVVNYVLHMPFEELRPGDGVGAEVPAPSDESGSETPPVQAAVRLRENASPGATDDASQGGS